MRSTIKARRKTVCMGFVKGRNTLTSQPVHNFFSDVPVMRDLYYERMKFSFILFNEL